MSIINENTFSSSQKKVVESDLYQVIDVIQEDVSGSATRRKYQTFVTGGIGPGVTSSLYQTIYDQDFTLQTANPVMDMTMGLFHYDDGTNQRKNLVTLAGGYARSSTTEQLTFGSNHLMVREKINVYRQYASYLLGDPRHAFSLGNSSGHNWPYWDFTDSTTVAANCDKMTDGIMDACTFINIKRLFGRDQIRPQTFAMRCYRQAATWSVDKISHNNVLPISGGSWAESTTGNNAYQFPWKAADNAYTEEAVAADQKWNTEDGSISTGNTNEQEQNIDVTSEMGVQIIADLNTMTIDSPTGGLCSRLVLASDTSVFVGLIFYDAGIVVLNLGMSSRNSSGDAGTVAVQAGATFWSNNLAGAGPIAEDYGLGGDRTSVGFKHLPVFEPRDGIRGIIRGMNESNKVDTTANLKFGGALVLGSTGTAGGMLPIGDLKDANITQPHNRNAKFYPDLLMSASIDDIVDHIANTRFSSGSLSAMAFQNTTHINSTLYFCRAEASEFNQSTNPTYNSGLASVATSSKFTYITTVTLNDSDGKPVAIAKLNRPIEKSEESEVTIRVRLDF